jgi:hypothetical protein
MAPIGKSLVFAGIAIVVVGLALWGLSSVPYVGRLPGDIYIRRGNFSFYFPLATLHSYQHRRDDILFADEALTNWQRKKP